MVRMLGYMLTWTTYGTWLQGDDRGYVKEGEICEGNTALRSANQQAQISRIVRLTKAQRHLVRVAIEREAELHKQDASVISSDKRCSRFGSGDL